MTLVAENLSLKIGEETWIYPFDLTLEPGSFTTVIGPTRAGKTSILRLLAGLSKSTGGRLMMGGQDVTNLSVRKRSIGMVYQEFVNYPGKTVFENIAAPLRNAGEVKSDIIRRVHEVATIVGIEDLLQRYPLELSGGQQQRLSIARTIAKPRELVLLDEPLVNLDYKLREHLRKEFRRLFADTKTIAVYASSEPLEALILDGDVIVLSKGKVLQHGHASDVYSQPDTESVARLICDPPMSIIPACLVGKGKEKKWMIGDINIGKEIARDIPLADGNYHLGLYPHNLSTTKNGATSLPAMIEFVEVSGSRSFIYAKYDKRTLAVKQQGIHSHEIGDPISVGIDIHRALVFKTNGELMQNAPTVVSNG